jgi:FlaA1/EpsC-like NDP-sugar epimerase
MTIPEAVQLVLQATGMAVGGDVFLLDMGEPVRIADLARQMIELSGLRVKDASTPDGDISIEFTGLRPGEKLFEELLISAHDEATKHPLIRRAKEPKNEKGNLDVLIQDLFVALDNWNESGTIELISKLVPEFINDQRHE